MECACVYIESDGYWEFHNSVYRKAIKEHKCSECSRVIQPGEIYEYVVGKWEGAFNKFKTCEDCENIRDTFFCDGWNYGMLWSDLWDYLLEINGDVPASCILPLTDHSKNKVFAMIDRVWNEYST